MENRHALLAEREVQDYHFVVAVAISRSTYILLAGKRFLGSKSSHSVFHIQSAISVVIARQKGGSLQWPGVLLRDTKR